MSCADDNKDMRHKIRALNAAIPGATQGFAALSKAAKEEGVLDFKTKEFLALAISVATRCDACINFHIEALVRIGATRDEIGDVLAMCLQMGGGPSLMYAAKALACWDELTG